MNNIQPQATTCERLSALADGELDNQELLLLLEACKTDQSAAESWGSYQLISEALRAGPLAGRGPSYDFVQRLNRRIENEHLLTATATAASPVLPKLHVAHGVPAANDSIFRWKLVAGFASLTAVAAIAWSSFAMISSPSGAQLAQALVVNTPAPQVLVVASPQGPMVRDARLEELLAAHRQLGGASVLQAPSGFLNAAFETPQNAGR